MRGPGEILSPGSLDLEHNVQKTNTKTNMNIIKRIYHRATPFGVAVMLLLAAAIPAISFTRSATAAPLTNRGLEVTSTVASDELTAPDGTIYTGLAAGDPRNGAQVGHTYTFTVGSDTDLEGFTIEYCTSAFGFVGGGACSGPNAFSAVNWQGKTVTVENDTANTTQAFTVVATGNTIILTSGTALGVTAGDIIIIDFPVATGFFVNPDTNYKNDPITNGTYFAHIATYATQAAATAGIANDTGFVDDGTVANNVTTAIGIYTRVQETLNFSVEGDDNEDDGSPGQATDPGTSCAPLAVDGQLKMGDENHALRFTQAYYAKSYFRLSTNSTNGVGVYYAGDTLRSPHHALAAMGTSQTPSAVGSEQFGMAFDLTDNLSGNVGLTGDLTPVSAYGNSTAGYAFNALNPADTKLLASTDGTVACDTGAVQYVANIAPETPAGIYQTQINYIAAPKY